RSAGDITVSTAALVIRQGGPGVRSPLPSRGSARVRPSRDRLRLRGGKRPNSIRRPAVQSDEAEGPPQSSFRVQCPAMATSSRSEFPLLEYMDSLVEDVRGHVPDALKKWDADAIHDARVGTRRLKAAVDLMEPVLSKEHRKPFAKVLRN